MTGPAHQNVSVPEPPFEVGGHGRHAAVPQAACTTAARTGSGEIPREAGESNIVVEMRSLLGAAVQSIHSALVTQLTKSLPDRMRTGARWAS